jgi:hypothetical protein
MYDRQYYSSVYGDVAADQGLAFLGRLEGYAEERGWGLETSCASYYAGLKLGAKRSVFGVYFPRRGQWVVYLKKFDPEVRRTFSAEGWAF